MKQKKIFYNLKCKFYLVALNKRNISLMTFKLTFTNLILINFSKIDEKFGILELFSNTHLNICI